MDLVFIGSDSGLAVYLLNYRWFITDKIAWKCWMQIFPIFSCIRYMGRAKTTLKKHDISKYLTKKYFRSKNKLILMRLLAMLLPVTSIFCLRMMTSWRRLDTASWRRYTAESSALLSYWGKSPGRWELYCFIHSEPEQVVKQTVEWLNTSIYT